MGQRSVLQLAGHVPPPQSTTSNVLVSRRSASIRARVSWSGRHFDADGSSGRLSIVPGSLPHAPREGRANDEVLRSDSSPGRIPQGLNHADGAARGVHFLA